MLVPLPVMGQPAGLQEALAITEGWIRQYGWACLHRNYPDLGVTEQIYLTLQPVGLLYGVPFDYPSNIQESLITNDWPEKTGLGIAWLGSVAQMYSIRLQHAVRKPDIDRFTQGIRSWFHIHEADHQSQQSLFHYMAFWDMLAICDWLTEGNASHTTLPEYRKQVTEHKLFTIDVIASAAQANDTIEKEELTFLKKIIRNAGLNLSYREHVRDRIKNPVRIQGLDFSTLPPLGRKFIYDVACMIIMCDRHVTDEEELFLRQLAVNMSFTQAEADQSRAMVGLFMLRYQDQIPFLSGNQFTIRHVARVVKDRTLGLLGALKDESLETRDMALTFGKLLQMKLRMREREDMPSQQEIHAAIQQLKDIPRFAPFFSVIVFPVPGITEMYTLLALGIEEMTDHRIKLLPNSISRAIRTGRHHRFGQ